MLSGHQDSTTIVIRKKSHEISRRFFAISKSQERSQKPSYLSAILLLFQNAFQQWRLPAD
jgi:hypothetical protein